MIAEQHWLFRNANVFCWRIVLQKSAPCLVIIYAVHAVLKLMVAFGAARLCRSKRPSPNNRLRCAKANSTFLRSRRDCSNACVPAKEWARPRASSSMSRGMRRDRALRQHFGFSGQASQSNLLER